MDLMLLQKSQIVWFHQSYALGFIDLRVERSTVSRNKYLCFQPCNTVEKAQQTRFKEYNSRQQIIVNFPDTSPNHNIKKSKHGNCDYDKNSES